MPILHETWGFNGGDLLPSPTPPGLLPGLFREEPGHQNGNNYAVNLPLQATSSAFGGLGFSFATANLNIDVRIQAMEQQGRGKTISSPKVLTKDNTEARIKQGTSIPVTTQTVVSGTPVYSTTYIDANLELKVTPHISSYNNMRIKIDIVKKDPDLTNKDTLGNPYINIKEASHRNDGQRW